MNPQKCKCGRRRWKGMLNAVEVFKDGRLKEWVCGDCAKSFVPKFNKEGGKRYTRYAMARFLPRKKRIMGPQDLKEILVPASESEFLL